MKRSGDRFEILKEGSRWYWQLVIAHSPSLVPAARSGRGYASRPAVLKAVRLAQLAAVAAKGDPIFVEVP
jgi:hypothetical protein